MNFQEIKDFPINEFAADDSLLFLWVINKYLREGFDVLEKWGFKYHNIFTWVKGQGFALWSPIMTHTEHILIAWRGNLRSLCPQMGVMKNYLMTNYQLKHSEKPAKFYQMLRAWTPEPRIDIFARQRHYGFDGWGDEYVGEGPLAEWLE
jgi:N6-adenosine-specific RNA methylase IME4